MIMPPHPVDRAQQLLAKDIGPTAAASAVTQSDLHEQALRAVAGLTFPKLVPLGASVTLYDVEEWTQALGRPYTRDQLRDALEALRQIGLVERPPVVNRRAVRQPTALCAHRTNPNAYLVTIDGREALAIIDRIRAVANRDQQGQA